ncbi:invasion associated locus B family protein [Rhodovulum imhoffii]|nr:invasion associated locus B family protein [Rhodovulum imhoffii]MBK5933920.1 hypothetical protein [Rhodovulum imhoffii]
MALTAFAAQAQDSSNRVAANSDWSVFVEDNPTECWGVSAPKKTVNSRNGKVVEVRRGDILLFVSYRPGQSVKGEISFTGGYPFASGSTVKMQIGDKSYDFFTEGEWAWPASEADQAAIMTAMKGGAEAVATGVSSRGTTTKDTFSLMGFTAAVNEAARRCGG